MKVNSRVVAEATGSGRRLIVITLAMLDLTERVVGHTLREICEYYQKPELQFPIYTAIKEVALNGIKANMKRIVFQDNDLDPNNARDAEIGRLLLRQRIEAGNMVEFARESHRRGLRVSIEFQLEADHFMVEIHNNSRMTEAEEGSIRRKLQNALRYDNVAEFFMDDERDAADDEGAGLGMTLVSVMLRTQNIDPHNFVIFTREEQTTGRLEVPIAEDYVSRRQLYAERQLAGNSGASE